MYIFDADNAGVVGGLGLLLSVFGLLGTIVGFWITWKQLKRTKTATEASSEAVGKLRLRMAQYDTLAELSYAISATRETRRHIDGQQWKYALDGLEETRIFLTRILELSGDIIEDERVNMKSTISDLSLSAISLSKQMEKDDVSSGSKIRIRLNDALEFLNRLSIKVQRAAK